MVERKESRRGRKKSRGVVKKISRDIDKKLVASWSKISRRVVKKNWPRRGQINSRGIVKKLFAAWSKS